MRVRTRVVDDTLTALADPTRRGVIDLLRKRPHRAGELARHFDVSAPAMSRHLKVLRERGLVDDQRSDEDARARIFRLRREPFSELQAWLTRVEGFWSDQLDAFAEHVDKRRSRR